MNDNCLESIDKSADDQSMGNLSSTEIGNAIDERSVATLLMGQDLPDLTYNLTQALAKTSQSHQGSSVVERRAHDGTSRTESLQELDQADLAAILPDVTNGNLEVPNCATLSDGQIINQPKGQDEKDVSNEKGQSYCNNKNSNSTMPRLPINSSEQDQELFSSTNVEDQATEVTAQKTLETGHLSEARTRITNGLPPCTGVPPSTTSQRLTNSIRKSNRPIRHPLRGSEYLTLDRSLSSVCKRISSSAADTTSFTSPPKNCPTSVHVPVPGVRRRGRPKGAMNKKTIAMLNKTNIIRDSILEKLRAELFGQVGSSAVKSATVESQDASSSICTSSSAVNGLPSLPPPISSPISSILGRAHHPPESSLSSKSDPPILANKGKSKKGRKCNFEEISHKLGAVVASATNQDLSKHMHEPLSALERLGGGSISDSIPSGAQEPSSKQPSKLGRPRKGTNLRSKEQSEVMHRSSKTSTAAQKTDFSLLDSEASVAAGTSSQPYPSQLAAGSNAIGNIGLVAPLFSLPHSSTFVSSATSPHEAHNPISCSLNGKTNFLSRGSVGERQVSNFASIPVANDEASDLPCLEDLGNKRNKRKKKKHHKHHKSRQETEEVSHQLVPELDDLANHLEKIFITGPASAAKVTSVSCESVLDFIFRSSPNRQLLHQKEVWRQRNHAASAAASSEAAVVPGPVRGAVGRGRPRKKHLLERKSLVSSKGSVNSEHCLPLKKRHTLIAAAQLEPVTAADTEQNQKLPPPLNVMTRRGSGITSQRKRGRSEKPRPAAQKSSGFSC